MRSQLTTDNLCLDPFAKKHKCMWSTEEMEYTGVPFRVVSEYNLECSRAMNRHKCKEGNVSAILLLCHIVAIKLRMINFASSWYSITIY